MEHMYELKGTEAIISPSLIYYEEIIRENIKKTIRTAGSPERLWPHVKSHKSMDMVRMQMEYGITKFKTATVAEAEMAAMAGAQRVILAYPLVGPNMERFVRLAKAYPDTIFYGVEDDRAQFEALSRVCVEHDAVLPMLVDVNMGMNRTGVPIEGLEELYRFAYSLPGLRLCGMHCYDGNHNNKDAAVRRAEVDDTDRRVADIMERLTGDGICCELAVAGVPPPFHAMLTAPGGICLRAPHLSRTRGII